MRRFIGKTTRHNMLQCPHCGYSMDCSSGIGHDHKPSADAAAFCIDCGQWSIFTYTKGLLGMRKPTDDELMDLHLVKEVRDIEQVWIETATERMAAKAAADARKATDGGPKSG